MLHVSEQKWWIQCVSFPTLFRDTHYYNWFGISALTQRIFFFSVKLRELKEIKSVPSPLNLKSQKLDIFSIYFLNSVLHLLLSEVFGVKSKWTRIFGILWISLQIKRSLSFQMMFKLIILQQGSIKLSSSRNIITMEHL